MFKYFFQSQVNEETEFTKTVSLMYTERYAHECEGKNKKLPVFSKHNSESLNDGLSGSTTSF